MTATADTHTSELQGPPAADEAQRGFSRSMVVSGIRCVLTYIFLPLVGFTPGVGATLGLVLGTIAIAANVFSIRRFWAADHRYKKQVTVLHLAVIGLLLILVGNDIADLLG